MKHNSAITGVAPITVPADDDLALFSSSSDFPLNECQEALLESTALVADAGAYAKLYRLGIQGDGICGRRRFCDALAYEPVVFLPGRRFEFGRIADDASDHVMAVIIPARNEFGDVVDIAAWRPEDGSIALWRGKVSMLGEDVLETVRLDLKIEIFETIEGWLRAGRRGVLILDSERARWRLTGAGESLLVRSTEFGKRLEARLTLPKPTIFVMREAA